jgi:hypothetical protein
VQRERRPGLDVDRAGNQGVHFTVLVVGEGVRRLCAGVSELREACSLQ